MLEVAFPKKNLNRAFGAISKRPSWNLAKASETKADFTLSKISIDHVFSAIKNQYWVRCPKTLLANPKRTRAGSIVPSMIE